MTRVPGIAASAIVAMALLSGCATPDAQGGPSRIVVSAESIDVLGDDGAALATFDYRQPTAEVVEGLSEYLGEPVESRTRWRSDSLNATLHNWLGFQLFDTDAVEEGPYSPNHHIITIVGEVRGIAIETPDGISVGDPLDEIDLTSAEWEDLPSKTEGGQRTIRVDPVSLPAAEGVGDNPTLTVLVNADIDANAVDRISAPIPSYAD